MFGRAAAYAGSLFFLTLGATFNGIVQPGTRVMGMIALLIIGAAWLIGRRRWQWHATALDAALLVWVVAFVISLIANMDQARRIVIGIWYVGAYILAWFLLHDLLANRLLSRRVLMNGLLLAGLLIMVFGYLQTRAWLTTSLPLILSGAVEFTLPRPVSTLGNPNTLGAFLAVLLPFALEAARGSKGIARALLALYALLAGGLLALTYSRGAWIGAAAGVGVYALLLARRGGLLSPGRWRDLWARQTSFRRLLFGVAAAFVLLVGVAALILIARSAFSAGGRGTDTRAWIYDTALRTFSEQPVSGSGLFTFGVDLARFNGYPPYEPHAHAHNIVLHVAAELGVGGLIALALTAWAAGWMIWRNTRVDPVAVAGAGAAGAFALHHLFDVPLMNPAIALSCIIALVIAAAPVTPISLAGVKRRAVALTVPVTAIALALTGLWSTAIYGDYAAILSQTLSGALSAREGAERLQVVIDADPRLSIYSYEQGMLYGLAGDTPNAIRAFERYTTLDPDYGMGWLNLAVLHERAGNFDQAYTAARRATETSPREAIMWFHYAQAQARRGELDGALTSYIRVLRTDPDFRMLPTWDDDPIRVSAANSADVPPISGAAAAITLLRAGDVDRARDTWANSDYRSITPSRASAYVVDLLLALHDDDMPAAETALAAAQSWILAQGDVGWTRYGAACLARYRGDEASALAEIAAARAAVTLDLYESDWGFGANIGYTQTMRLMIPRAFLPEVEFPIVNQTLTALLEAFAAAPETRYSSCP